MVSFSKRKLPGIVTLCIVFFTKTLVSASPVPQGKRGGTVASAVPVPQGEHGGTLPSGVTQDDDYDDDYDDDRRSVSSVSSVDSSVSGLLALTTPAVNGIVDPLATGVGRGVAGAAGGTAQVFGLLGDAMASLLHVVGGVAANAEQGAGVAVANVAPAVQGTVYVQS